MRIQIYQGSTTPSTTAKITIVIDVIRAFTVSHYAFLQGVSKIFLAESIEHAFKLKSKNPNYLLAGEVNGLPIKGFDLDNSPYNMSQEMLTGKTLVQKTTNGVRATLNCISSESLFVTGFTNAKTTAEFIKRKFTNRQQSLINIIASHPSGDDDLACAEYIKSILEGSNSISPMKVVERIKDSHVANKFFDKKNSNFLREDIDYCVKEVDTCFVMQVNKSEKLPMIERVNICEKQS